LRCDAGGTSEDRLGGKQGEPSENRKPAEPREVLIDPALSKEQKMEALDALEQDASQLSVASAEGTTGGEPTKLHDVPDANDSLEVPPTGHAYGVVLSDLRSRLKAGVTGDTRDMLEKALAALDAATPKTATDAPASGAPRRAEGR
jgi:hypothetical protein